MSSLFPRNPAHSWASGIDRLAATLVETTSPSLGSSDSWTLVDYPMHLNCGDAALVLGEHQLAGRHGARITRVVDRDSYRRELLRDDVLPTYQAGGNWGGLYPTHHHLRLRFLAETKGRPAVQMPQSIHYADDRARDDLRRAVSGHGNLTLLVRDERSFETASRDYECDVRLVPDVAFALGPQKRAAPSTPVQVQARTDKESSRASLPFPTFDWLEAPARSTPSMALRAAVLSNKFQKKTRFSFARNAGRAGAMALAVTSVRRARSLLSRGEVVVTDRLHGHIMCVLHDIPHVVVNDKFGKIEALHTTWTSDYPSHVFVQGWSEVPDALRRLTGRDLDLG